ncbi:MAG: hypothetical protein QW733_01950 [Desulfurococcaceae archaeon]
MSEKTIKVVNESGEYDISVMYNTDENTFKITVYDKHEHKTLYCHSHDEYVAVEISDPIRNLNVDFKIYIPVDEWPIDYNRIAKIANNNVNEAVKELINEIVLLLNDAADIVNSFIE